MFSFDRALFLSLPPEEAAVVVLAPLLRVDMVLLISVKLLIDLMNIELINIFFIGVRCMMRRKLYLILLD